MRVMRPDTVSITRGHFELAFDVALIKIKILDQGLVPVVRSLSREWRFILAFTDCPDTVVTSTAQRLRDELRSKSWAFQVSPHGIHFL